MRTKAAISDPTPEPERRPPARRESTPPPPSRAKGRRFELSSPDWLWLGALAALAAWIWLRDRAWLSAAEEVLPIVAALPLFAWLGAPWCFRADAFSLHRPTLALAGACLVAGIAGNLTLLLALAWTAALWSWLRQRLAPDQILRAHRLLVLPLMAFPWVTLDGATLSWWFRLSAAWATAGLFHLIGFSVAREGTQLLVQGLPVSVDASCSGLKVLQAMLIAGTIIAFLQLGRTRSYWWSLPCLIGMAWLANTLRVLTLSATALSFGSEFAAGWFHAWGGWFVLVLMFALCWAVFALWRRAAAVPQGQPA
jgi:exosortase